MATTALTRQSVTERLGIERAVRRPLKSWLVGASVVGVIVALGALVWTRREQGQQIEFVTQAVARGDLRVTVTATGNLEPTNQVEVSSGLSGPVKTVEVDFYQRVRVGQVLARLDTTKLEAQIRGFFPARKAARLDPIEALRHE